MSSPQFVYAPTFTSQRSTRWSTWPMNPSASSRSTPHGPSGSTVSRAATAHSSPTASRTASSVSRQKRARFSNEPAVLVGAPVVERREELHREEAVRPVHVDDVEPGRAGPSAPRPRRGPGARGSPRSSPPGGSSSGRPRSRSGTARGARSETPCTARSAPPYQSSTLASASQAWTAAVVRARLRTSSSSQSRAETRWQSSDSGWIEQYSVQTAAHPPSAFIPRCPAWKPGFSEPAPLHWGVW